MSLLVALGSRSTRTTFPEMQRSLSLLLTYGNCPYSESFIHNAFGTCIWRLGLLIGKRAVAEHAGKALDRGHPCQRVRLNYNSQRAVPEKEGGFSCRKSVLALGPTTASRAGAALLQRDPGLWGPDRGRHGNGGSVVPGTGRGGGVHVRSPGFRFGGNKLPPAADDPGRARVLGIGVRNGDQGLDAALRGVLVVPSKGFGGEGVSRGGTALVGDIWG